MKEVSQMKSVEKRVDRILRDRVGALIASFQTEREEDLVELARLEQQIEYHEGEKEKLLEEQAGLNTVREDHKKRSWEIVLAVRSIDQSLKISRSQIEGLISRLTRIPSFAEDSELLNFLFVVTGKDKIKA